jgi:hypothetical protein
MRLTIGNLFDFGANGGETERSAGILARNFPELNPPYAGCRIAADALYKVGDVKEARRSIRRPAWCVMHTGTAAHMPYLHVLVVTMHAL